MFTGLIGEVGVVKRISRSRDNAHLQVVSKKLILELRSGDSIAVNGVCLTCENIEGESFESSLLRETLLSTNLQFLKPGAKVNLELPLRVGDRVGGHFVLGHVDGISEVISLKMHNRQTEAELQLKLPATWERYVFEGASIAINGVSLTVREVTKNRLLINLIPYTLKHTNLGKLRAKDFVNIEFDVIVKSTYHSIVC